MKKKLFTLSICLGGIIIIALIAYLTLPHVMFKPLVKEKSFFTDTESLIITEKINIDPDELQAIEKVRLSHAQDTLYIIDATLNSSSSIKNNYKFESSYENTEKYVHKNNYNMFCELNENDSSYHAIFYIYEYDNKLTSILK